MTSYTKDMSSHPPYIIKKEEKEEEEDELPSDRTARVGFEVWLDATLCKKVKNANNADDAWPRMQAWMYDAYIAWHVKQKNNKSQAEDAPRVIHNSLGTSSSSSSTNVFVAPPVYNAEHRSLQEDNDRLYAANDALYKECR